MTMTSRERIKAALNFEPPDELPCNESPWDQTPAVWREQGLPEGVDIADFFGFDIAMMYLDTSPRFEQKIIRREAGLITYEDRYGYTITKTDGESATLHFLSHKTSDRDGWERARGMFAPSDDPAAPARIDDRGYFAHFDPYPTWEQAAEKFRRVRATGRYVLFMLYGPWEATWRHRGMETLLLDVALDPDWVREMAETYHRLVVSVLDRCLSEGMKPDGVFLAEDLACCKGLMISPASWREIFKPSISSLGAFLRDRDIDFWLHSDGRVIPLIDDLIECGVQVLNPLEAKAGMDVVELRGRYGKRLAFHGNIDVNAMCGPWDELEAELRRKVPIARDGGYIFHSDHSVPPAVSFERYCRMLEAARSIFRA